MTRTEKRLIVLSNKRKRIADRIFKNAREHKSTKDLQARLIDATVEQLKVERRLERKRA